MINLLFVEVLSVEIVFVNPLKIPLNLLDLHLLWEFTPKDLNGQNGDTMSNKVCRKLEILIPHF